MDTVNLQEYIDKLEDFKNLGENWDSYGAHPLSEDIIEKAKSFLKLLKSPYFGVFPGSDGSISFVWYDVDDSTFSVTINPDGRHTVYHYSKDWKWALGEDQG